MNLGWLLLGLAVLAIVVLIVLSGGGEPKGHDFDRNDEEDRRI
jgi:hypothetical protein